MSDDDDQLYDEPSELGEEGLEGEPIDGTERTTAHPRFRARRAELADQSRRKRNRRMVILGGLIGLLFLAAGATQTALLDVDEIRIVGAERTDPDELRAATGVELGTPVLGLDTAEVERQLRNLPAVKRVTVEAGWNGVLTVEILERIPIARIDAPEGTMVLAADGMVIEMYRPVVTDGSPENPEDLASAEAAETTESMTESVAPPELPADISALPEISGAMFLRDVGEFVPSVLDDALEVATALPADIGQVTAGVEITVDSLILRAVGGGRISLGDSRNLDEKFSAVRAFLAQVDLSCLDTLNVQAPTVPVIRRNTGC